MERVCSFYLQRYVMWQNEGQNQIHFNMIQLSWIYCYRKDINKNLIVGNVLWVVRCTLNMYQYDTVSININIDININININQFTQTDSIRRKRQIVVTIIWIDYWKSVMTLGVRKRVSTPSLPVTVAPTVCANMWVCIAYAAQQYKTGNRSKTYVKNGGACPIASCNNCTHEAVIPSIFYIKNV